MQLELTKQLAMEATTLDPCLFIFMFIFISSVPQAPCSVTGWTPNSAAGKGENHKDLRVVKADEQCELRLSNQHSP